MTLLTLLRGAFEGVTDGVDAFVPCSACGKPVSVAILDRAPPSARPEEAARLCGACWSKHTLGA